MPGPRRRWSRPARNRKPPAFFPPSNGRSISWIRWPPGSATSYDVAGHTHQQRSLILPQRPYQILAERDPPGFQPYPQIRRYACGQNSQLQIGFTRDPFQRPHGTERRQDPREIQPGGSDAAGLRPHAAHRQEKRAGPRVVRTLAGLGTRRRFRSTTPGLVTRSTARPEGVQLDQRAFWKATTTP